MKKVIYRRISKADIPEIEQLVSDAFGLHEYVEDKNTLDLIKKMYVASCLAEEKFNKVAVVDGKIAGVIMGGSDHEKYTRSNVKNGARMLYHAARLWTKTRTKKIGKNEVQQTYKELISDIKEEFDGVLTLFAVRRDVRGLGIGKGLLVKMNTYYRKHNTKKIYLYTDDTCNYGFYDHMGFTRAKETTVTVQRKGQAKTMDVYVYSQDVPCEEKL